MQIDVVSSVQGFDALEPHWRALEQDAAASSLFLGWDWQRLWWQHYGAGRQLRILVARRGQRIVGLLPLYLETHRAFKLLPVRKLRPIGVGGDTAPDDLGMLSASAEADAVAQALIAYLLGQVHGWQLLELVDLPVDSPLAHRWDAALAQSPSLMQRTDINRITYGDLPPDWERYRQGLSRDRRQALARYRRKFEQLPGARFHQVTQTAEIDAAFDRLAALHVLRWKGRTQELSFTSAQYLAFHREVMRALMGRGRLRLFALELEGNTIAMLYGFRWGDTFYHFQGGFDPAHGSLSPGQILMAYAIEQAIGEGCKTFDTLKGDYGHKRHFFQQTRETTGLRIYRPGLIHWLYQLKDRLGADRATPQPARADDAEGVNA